MTAYEAWAAAAGQTFEAADGGGGGESHSVRLTSVGPARRANGWLGYSLHFTAATDSPLGQDTYELAGAGIAEAVFLVPSGRTADSLTLEAVFMVPDTDSTVEEER